MPYLLALCLCEKENINEIRFVHAQHGNCISTAEWKGAQIIYGFLLLLVVVVVMVMGFFVVVAVVVFWGHSFWRSLWRRQHHVSV